VQNRNLSNIKTNNKSELKETVRNMKEDSKTQVEIADELKISQASISRYLNE
jgi:DNA-directed RNA polymerase specialized sigma subunit